MRYHMLECPHTLLLVQLTEHSGTIHTLQVQTYRLGEVEIKVMRYQNYISAIMWPVHMRTIWRQLHLCHSEGIHGGH